MRVLTILVTGLLGGAAATAAEPPASCGEIPAAHSLDFWLGEWVVRDASGTLAGHNRIEPILGGCALLEHWTGATGAEGKSLFYFQAWLEEWRQVWVTAGPLRPGSVKEKRLVEHMDDGGVRFQGEVAIAADRSILDRTTLTPLADGRVRQLIEWSGDGGETWNPGFEGYYARP